MSISIREAAEAAGLKILRESGADTQILSLFTDSRRIYQTEHSMFIAIKGERHDGHQFIPALIESGIKHFLVEEDISIPDDADVSILRADNSIAALQKLAAWQRSRFNIPVVGITGSNGKTIVKEWLYQLLHPSKKIVRSPKSYNSQIGVPLSVWQMSADDELGIFEAGISKKDEMQNLEKIIRPTIGIFTNLGQAHDEGFSSMTDKLAEKMELFAGAELIIYCKDHKEIDAAVRSHKLKSLSWGADKDADLLVKKMELHNGATKISVIFKNTQYELSIPFTDKASAENAMHAFTAGIALGEDAEKLIAGLKELHPVEMRLQLREGINNCDLVNDSYSSDLNSLLIALDFLQTQSRHKQKTLILSDFIGAGSDKEKLYQEVSRAAEKKGISRIVGIGPEISAQRELFNIPGKEFYADTDEFLHHFRASSFRNEGILVKGARLFRFERISRRLEKRSHETVLEINLNAVEHNLNFFRSMLKPGVKLMAMVKAYSYGSGAYEIARLMQFHRVDYLGVAYPDEGIALRQAGITMPVMIMNTDEENMELLPEYGLEPVLYDFHSLRAFSAACERSGTQGAGFHIEVDTGMHRLGFEITDAGRIADELKKNENIHLRSVFSHLSGSDEWVHDQFTRLQIDRFSTFCSELSEKTEKSFLKHILNSAGILRFSEAQFDMVRLGIGLYGIDPSTSFRKELENVVSLKTHISQIRTIAAGESVGYGRMAVSDKERKIGVLAIGYADGLNRALSNGKGKVWINGHLAPIAGNVCMDMTMVDLSGIQAAVGDEVIIFGRENPIEELAAALGTIPYEVLTGISQRVKRIYYYG